MQFNIIKITLQLHNFSKDGGIKELMKEFQINQVKLVEMFSKVWEFVLVETKLLILVLFELKSLFLNIFSEFQRGRLIKQKTSI